MIYKAGTILWIFRRDIEPFKVRKDYHPSTFAAYHDVLERLDYLPFGTKIFWGDTDYMRNKNKWNGWAAQKIQEEKSTDNPYEVYHVYNGRVRKLKPSEIWAYFR